MKALDTVLMALDFADRVTLRLSEDMRDAPLVQPTPRGGNHAWWVLGHLALIETSVPSVIHGEPYHQPALVALFAPGTQPSPTGAGYPPFDELLRAYRDARARNRQMLISIGEAGLDRAPKAPPRGLESEFQTIGQSLLTIALHQLSHMGQVADCRRAAGREPMFTPEPAA